MKKISISLFIALLLSLATQSFSQQVSNTAGEGPVLETKIVDLNDALYANTSFSEVIAKYKGKVIYLDFWASWCGPCRKEMPYSLELQKKYSGKDIVFVYMSTDKNAQAWNDMVNNLKLTGMNYRASDKAKQEIFQQFNLQYIPRYVLIDKEGNVVDQNAKRPSDPSVTSEIDKLL